MSEKFKSVSLIAIAQVLALATWFSASAVVPSLRAEFDLGDVQASLFTSSVQAGFVVGAITSALLSLPDRYDPRRLMLGGILVAALFNASILLVDPTSSLVLLCRFVTGISMAMIYPVGMKLVASWAKADMGLLVGLLVGALTLGSALPHLINAFGGLDWRFTIAGASAVTLIAALLVLLIKPGPNLGAAPPLKLNNAFKAWTTPSLRYANIGYLGHMWELYAMWAWLGVFLSESFAVSMGAGAETSFWARGATFIAMGVGGAIGCLAAGLLADRLGRTTITISAMAISGSCAAVTGFLFGSAPILLFVICLIWGASVVADSAQFSASIAELSEPDLIGTMLTMQTSMGFLLTMITVHLVPVIQGNFGWGPTFALLAVGPIIGCLGMWRLRQHPDAVKLASGRR